MYCFNMAKFSIDYKNLILTNYVQQQNDGSEYPDESGPVTADLTTTVVHIYKLLINDVKLVR